MEGVPQACHPALPRGTYPCLTLQRAYSHALGPQEAHVGLRQQRHFIICVWVEISPGPAGGVPGQLLASCGFQFAAGRQLQHVVTRVRCQQGRPGQAEAIGQNLYGMKLMWLNRI